MSDPADNAQRMIDAEAEAIQQRARALVLEPAENCIECGEMISSLRQAATGGTQYCRDCAEAIEVKRRGFA